MGFVELSGFYSGSKTYSPNLVISTVGSKGASPVCWHTFPPIALMLAMRRVAKS